MSGWMNYAACQGQPTQLFVPDVPDSKHMDSHVQEALKSCRACPVKANCARLALDAVDNLKQRPYGVWAGLVFDTKATRAKVDQLREVAQGLPPASASLTVRVHRLREAGMPIPKIADVLKVSSRTVHRHLNRVAA